MGNQDENRVDPAIERQRHETVLDKFVEKLNDWKISADSFFARMKLAKPKDVTYYRRFICCKIKQFSQVDAVITALMAIGFTDIIESELLGRRASRSMLQYILDDQIHRLHVRIHAIDKTFYLLVHKEPVPSPNVNDLLFHARGFLERVGRQINAYFTGIAADPARVKVNYNERAELSDYEQGCQGFRELVKVRDPALYQMLDFYLDEHDFLSFSLKFGNVSNILPVELLLSDFTRNIQSTSLVELSGNIHSILDMLGFRLMKRLPLKVKLGFIKTFPAMTREMEAVIEGFFDEGPATNQQGFACLFSNKVLDPDFITKIVEYFQIEGRVHVLILVNDAKMEKNIPFDVKKLRKKNIHASLSTLQIFKSLFESFLYNPFSPEALLSLMEENEFITSEEIDQLSRRRIDTQHSSKIVLDVLNFLGKNPGWHQAKHLKQELMKTVEFAGVSEANLDHVFDFLKNPLIELVKTRRDGKELGGIENTDELKLKLSNMKKMLGSIDMKY